MTAISRLTASAHLRLPLALGVAGLMTMGSAAMAWPVLKGAFTPVPSGGMATSPADPAAISGFVDMTRAQMTAQPAVADPAGIPDIVLVQATDLPRFTADIYTGSDTETANTPFQDRDEQSTGGDDQQAQPTRPEPRPFENVQSDSDSDYTPFVAPVRRVPLRVTPVAQTESLQNRAPGEGSQRLLNVWVSGAFR
ncbi:hypothetical protein [Roseinatronobacter alkalisoli]|uniref:Uncharacterized protein n=1 Tax=Roseinatronobacter alkalisoli TaxID=3028235 RepID=A0ABT5TA05_9RHOB|nr:hypothetical protein [Roseinatronobacter sp. HJB301]MDD7971947.1 hypothetical protein [Roseinatronobacter sp. HJB301]